MIVLSGAELVLPEGIRSEGTLVLEGERIVEIRLGATGAMGAMGATGARGATGATDSADAIDLRGHIVLPGFIDVHVHGLEGIDTLDGEGAVAAIAARLAKYGVTGFCPTTVACGPGALRGVLDSVAMLRRAPVASGAARVLPAHLESNFINPEYRGAQPVGCLRSPMGAVGAMGATGAMGLSRRSAKVEGAKADATDAGVDFDGHDILAEIDAAGASAGIVTLAPELEDALDLIRHLVSRGHRVSLGHSGATLEQSRAAIAAGARHATHLFNRMPPLDHRRPGLVGAILASEQVAAEIICDGVHVHRDMVRMAIAAKGASRMMAITDGVSAAGLPEGSTALLGGRTIRVRSSAAYLEDGTLAGSVATMDRVFRFLVNDAGLSLNDAVLLCATTPASELGLEGTGVIAKGAIADLVVMDRGLNVQRTYVGGQLAYTAPPRD
jgi:N-acetylglucosamine-6-phosphate deacetylase